MRMALSTNWNVRRHNAGEAMIDEILALGFDALELGYHTTEEVAAGVLRRVQAGTVTVDSIHAYCPVPLSAPHGYPELYLLASLDEDERAMASILLGRTLTFAASMGARAVVLHAGRIQLNSLFGELHTSTLIEALEEEGSPEGAKYQRLLEKALRRRSARVRKYFDGFCLSLDALLPKFEKAGVALCLENLPSIEAFPDEQEIQMLKQRFDTPALAYWYDIGHGQVRENMGWIRNAEAARELLPITRGIHMHDTATRMDEHLPPGKGLVAFEDFSFYGSDEVIKVFEPSPEVTPQELKESLQYVRQLWGDAGALTGARPPA